MVRPRPATGHPRSLRTGRGVKQIPAAILGVGKKRQGKQADNEIGLDHLILLVVFVFRLLQLLLITCLA